MALIKQFFKHKICVWVKLNEFAHSSKINFESSRESFIVEFRFQKVFCFKFELLTCNSLCSVSECRIDSIKASQKSFNWSLSFKPLNEASPPGFGIKLVLAIRILRLIVKFNHQPTCESAGCIYYILYSKSAATSSGPSILNFSVRTSHWVADLKLWRSSWGFQIESFKLGLSNWEFELKSEHIESNVLTLKNGIG